MAVDEAEQRDLLNRQLLRAAREDGNIEELLTSTEYRDAEDDFLFDINCTDISGNTPLHFVVSNGTLEHIGLFIEADGCDVDPQNNAGDTPLHLAVKIDDRDTRYAVVFILVRIAGASDSIRIKNKAGQTPNDLAKIYSPNDPRIDALTTEPARPARQVHAMLDEDDIASDGEDGPGSDE